MGDYSVTAVGRSVVVRSTDGV